MTSNHSRKLTATLRQVAHALEPLAKELGADLVTGRWDMPCVELRWTVVDSGASVVLEFLDTDGLSIQVSASAWRDEGDVRRWRNRVLADAPVSADTEEDLGALSLALARQAANEAILWAARHEFDKKDTLPPRHPLMSRLLPRPPGTRRKQSHRAALIEEIVESLTPGKVAKITLTESETPRGAKGSFSRAAKKLGRSVMTRENDGVVYVELVEGRAAETRRRPRGSAGC